jgi:hypothetical protein
VLPDTAEVYNIVGADGARPGRRDDAAGVRDRAAAGAASPAARQNLGQIRHEQGRALLEARRFRDAAAELRRRSRCCRRRRRRTTISAWRSRR